MHITDIITSRQNPKLKHVLRLQKSQVRFRGQLFVVEGLKEIEKAVIADFIFETIFFCPRIISLDKLQVLIPDMNEIPVYEVSADVFEKMAYRENTGGVIVLARMKQHEISRITANQNPLYLVLEGVEKPGNLGAIYRTADAAGIDSIIICNPKTDIYNPNTIRASLGCVFTVPTVITDNSTALTMLKQNNIQILSTYLQAAIPYHTADFKLPTAIVMGTEATGISPDWIQAADANIIIPMKGYADSMNVSVSTAIVVFEALRQRGF